MWHDRVFIDGASGKLFVIGQKLQEENSSCKFGRAAGNKSPSHWGQLPEPEMRSEGL